jgi:hypothetical protein
MLLAVYKFALNHSTGNGLKISKFHFGVHAKDDIDRFGPPALTIPVLVSPTTRYTSSLATALKKILPTSRYKLSNRTVSFG